MKERLPAEHVDPPGLEIAPGAVRDAFLEVTRRIRVLVGLDCSHTKVRVGTCHVLFEVCRERKREAPLEALGSVSHGELCRADVVQRVDEGFLVPERLGEGDRSLAPLDRPLWIVGEHAQL